MLYKMVRVDIKTWKWIKRQAKRQSKPSHNVTQGAIIGQLVEDAKQSKGE